MAKVTFNKLGLSKKNEAKEITLFDQTIEITQYLPIEEKLKMIQKIINFSAEDKFYNPCQVQVYFLLEMVYNYTNISFTEKQKEDFIKIFDTFQSNNVFQLILNEIPNEEIEFLSKGLEETLKSIYTYQNSVLGILENVSQDYSNLNLDAEVLKEKIINPENLQLLKQIAPALGLE